jgi:hypothetical protein
MLQAAIGGTTLRRAVGYPAPLDNGRDICRFFFLTPVLCVTSSTLSLSGLLALGVLPRTDLVTNWVSWWIGVWDLDRREIAQAHIVLLVVDVELMILGIVQMRRLHFADRRGGDISAILATGFATSVVATGQLATTITAPRYLEGKARGILHS